MMIRLSMLRLALMMEFLHYQYSKIKMMKIILVTIWIQQAPSFLSSPELDRPCLVTRQLWLLSVKIYVSFSAAWFTMIQPCLQHLPLMMALMINLFIALPSSWGATVSV